MAEPDLHSGGCVSRAIEELIHSSEFDKSDVDFMLEFLRDLVRCEKLSSMAGKASVAVDFGFRLLRAMTRDATHQSFQLLRPLRFHQLLSLLKSPPHHDDPDYWDARFTESLAEWRLSDAASAVEQAHETLPVAAENTAEVGQTGHEGSLVSCFLTPVEDLSHNERTLAPTDETAAVIPDLEPESVPEPGTEAAKEPALASATIPPEDAANVEMAPHEDSFQDSEGSTWSRVSTPSSSQFGKVPAEVSEPGLELKPAAQQAQDPAHEPTPKAKQDPQVTGGTSQVSVPDPAASIPVSKTPSITKEASVTRVSTTCSQDIKLLEDLLVEVHDQHPGTEALDIFIRRAQDLFKDDLSYVNQPPSDKAIREGIPCKVDADTQAWLATGAPPRDFPAEASPAKHEYLADLRARFCPSD